MLNRKFKVLLALFLLVAFPSLIPLTPTVARHWQFYGVDVEVPSSSLYVDSMDRVHVVGEVWNKGKDVVSVVVHAEFYMLSLIHI